MFWGGWLRERSVAWNGLITLLLYPEVYLGLCHICNIYGFFAKLVISSQDKSTLDVWQGPIYAYMICHKNHDQQSRKHQACEILAISKSNIIKSDKWTSKYLETHSEPNETSKMELFFKNG